MKLIRNIAGGILLILLIINITVIIAGEKEGSAIINKLPVAVLPVVSDSMSPKINGGDVIVVKQTPFENIKKGDVVVFADGDDLTVHEVVARNGETAVTKGIANDISDNPITEEEYRAKVLFKVPLLGGIWRIMSMPSGTALFITLLILLIFGDQIFGKLYRRLFEKNGTGKSKENN